MEARSAEFRRQLSQNPADLSVWAKLYAANQTLLSAIADNGAGAALIEICSNLLGCEEVAIVEISRQTGAVLFVAEAGMSPRSCATLTLNAPLLEGRIVPGSPIVTSDSERDSAELVVLGITALVPLWSDEQSTAAMILFRLLPQRSGFDAEDREVLRLLSNHAGPCLRCNSGQ